MPEPTLTRPPVDAVLRPLAVHLASLETYARTHPRIRYGDCELDPPEHDAARILAAAVLEAARRIAHATGDTVSATLDGIYRDATADPTPTGAPDA